MCCILTATTSRSRRLRADVAQLVEHSLGKGEVISSILIIGSRVWKLQEDLKGHGFSAARVGNSRAASAAEAVRAGVTQW